jgi:diacylglycerol kinase (CTP)
MPLKGRNDKHLARRIWHVSGVLSVFIWYWLIPPKAAALFAVVVGATFWWLFRPILRESERNRISGISWMVVGVGLIIFIYPKNVVLLALLFLAFADPMASEIGIRFGKDKLIGNKSLQGSLAAFAVCFVTSMIYFNALDLMRERLFIVSLLGGLIGAVSELLPLGKMDDNFVFPVLSATMLTGLFHIFGGF